MGIIVSRNGVKAQKVERSDFEKEDKLQQYIHDNPESIPIYDIQENKRLLVIAREFPTRSGPIDALAVDQDGDIYIIETKLYKNPDKRTVVAQALDYGASIWTHYKNFEDFYKIIESGIQKSFNTSLEEKAKEFFDLEDEQSQTMIEAMRVNLHEGIIRFVILMDSMDEKLKDLISYINQNSQFDIYGVQLEYYRFDEYEITIPKIFGVVNKSVGPQQARRLWSDVTFLEDAKNNTSEKGFQYLRDLYEFTEKNADKMEFGTGKVKGSFTYKFKDSRVSSGYVSIFTVYTNGLIQFRFANIKERIGDDNCILYAARLSKIISAKRWDDKEVLTLKEFGPTLELEKAFPEGEVLEAFKSMILEYVNQIKEQH